MEEGAFINPSGRLVTRVSPGGEEYRAFVPAALPPAEEREAILPLTRLLGDANHALGQLDGVGSMLQDPDLLVRPYMRREAVRSSRIEGTQASFADLVTFEATDLRLEKGDVREVYNYLDALDYGLRHIHDDGPGHDLVRMLHCRLLTEVRGERFGTPGEFRTIQNHIGGPGPLKSASFVPPPPDEMVESLDALVEYMQADKPQTPLLVELAWVHYQFEVIHPFIDGNGRVGRLLIPLVLAERRRLSHPLLYLSPYFEAHRQRYYDLLFAVSARSAWQAWLEFFLRGVLEQAQEGVDLARRLLGLYEDWRQRLLGAKSPANAHRALELVQRSIAVDAAMVEHELGVATQTAYKQISVLERLGIIREVTGRSHGRLYVATELLEVMDGAA